MHHAMFVRIAEGGSCDIAGFIVFQRIVLGVGHAEGMEDVLLFELIERHAGYFFDYRSQQYEAEVAVFPLLANGEAEGEVFYEFYGQVAVRRLVEEWVPFVEAGGVGEQ
jgi:hypothetical protein